MKNIEEINIINSGAPNILIVDDLPANLKILGAILESEGYVVRPVPNGRLALQVSEKEMPDLILLDIMMPEMDGFEVCRQFKENPDLKDIPIIFISALSDSSDIVKALKAGGVDYITKPFNAEEVIVRVGTHLKIFMQKKEIEQQNKQLQKLNSERDKIYSIIAHDLRGPFNGFLGLTQILAEELAGMSLREIQSVSANMRFSAVNLYRLLENLLDLTRLQQGLIKVKQEEVQILHVADKSLVMILEQAKNKGLVIETIIPVNLKAFADSNILQSIIRNIVSNAVKFTPKDGKITLSAYILDDSFIEISVRDTGIGMSNEMINNLFSIELQVNRHGTEGEPSTGLGLMICKDFIEKHGGRFIIESEEGKGSNFRFTVPRF